MIAATIGKMFLNAYNKKYGSDYDAQSFFVEIFYPLFFGKEKNMLFAGNTPLGNPSIKNKYSNFQELREYRLKRLMEKIAKGDADGGVAIDFPSPDYCSKNSGQVTNMQIPLEKNDIYYSWIGNGLGIGLGSGKDELTILFMDSNILLDIYEGWKYYRLALENNEGLKEYQIHAWNAQWVTHLYDEIAYDEDQPLANFHPYISDKNNIRIEPIKWTKVLFHIATHCKKERLTAYIYRISKENSTIGIIPFELGQITKPMHIYRKLFGLNKRISAPIWESQYGFKEACTFGAIGIKVIEPKGLRPYMTGSARSPSIPKAPNSEEQTIKYYVYETWLLAMLNNNDLWDKSQKLALMLVEASTDKSKVLSTKSKNVVEDVLSTYNKKQFVAAITSVIPLIEDSTALKEIVKDIHEMPNDNVPYFTTLVRFQFAMLNKNK